MSIKKEERPILEVPNVFSKGVLVHLKVRCYGGRSRVPKSFYDDSEKLPADITRAVQDILPLSGGASKTALRELHEMRDDAKRYLYRFSLPYPVDGLIFILKKDILAVDAGLKRRQEDFSDKVEIFLSGYPKAIEEYAEHYPEQHKAYKERYPSLLEMRKKFSFEWSFRQFTVPDKALSVLPPEIYQEELMKARQDAIEMREAAVSAIGQKFLAKIDSLKEQCLGGKISSNTVEALKTFLDKFMGGWDDYLGHEQLTDMVEQVKEYLDDIGPGELKTDDAFRAMVGAKMEDICEQFQKAADERLHRRIDI